MPGPGYQRKSSKRKTATPNTAVASPTNGNMTMASESNTSCTQPVLASAIDFRSFLEIADYKSIGRFCTWASATSEGANLRLLWERAMDKGEKLGVKKGRKLGIEEGIERGMDLGREEGYWVAKEGFDRIMKGVKAKGTPKKSNTHEMVTQANDDLLWQSTASQTTSTTAVNAVMQTASNNEPLRPLSDTGTSTELPSTCNTASQACGEPPAPTAPVTSPPSL
jgi:hypothetical protein